MMRWARSRGASPRRSARPTSVTRMSPSGDAMAPLIELQYQYIEQALGKKTLDVLANALDGFIRARGKPVRHVELPAVAPAGDLSD